MARLLYSTIASLDGYVADTNGGFEWAAPDEQVHAYINDQERAVGTYLYGRRMYEVMAYWETALEAADHDVERDYAQIWLAADKVVYSSTLAAVTTERTRLERVFDVDEVRRMKESAGSDLGVGGPGLAAHALRAGLVDDVHLYVVPVLVGGGTRAWPDGVRADLELAHEHRFDSGFVHLHYRVGS